MEKALSELGRAGYVDKEAMEQALGGRGINFENFRRKIGYEIFEKLGKEIRRGKNPKSI